MHNEWIRGPCLRLLASSAASAQNHSRTETSLYSDNATS